MNLEYNEQRYRLNLYKSISDKASQKSVSY